MQVILHIGVHCTDDDKLLKSLLRNAETLRSDGVAIPGPGRYRETLSELVNNLAETRPADDARDVVLDIILNEDPDTVDRLILSHPNLFSVPKLTFGGGRLYRKAEPRLQTMCDIFRGDQVELFMGLRNPATFLPAVFDSTPHETLDDFMNGVDPVYVRWSDLLTRIRADVPEVPITVWANEDTPLIWGQIIRDMAGIDPTRKISGAFNLFAEIISPEGMKRFREFLREHPNINEIQKRRVMTAFLDKYALEDEIEEELDLPGWDDAYVEQLTEIYEDDLYQIGRMPGVTLITP